MAVGGGVVVGGTDCTQRKQTTGYRQAKAASVLHFAPL